MGSVNPGFSCLRMRPTGPIRGSRRNYPGQPPSASVTMLLHPASTAGLDGLDEPTSYSAGLTDLGTFPVELGRSEPDFDATIAPLLVRHCLDCHSGRSPRSADLTQHQAVRVGGDSGPVLVAGQPEDSLLWQRVRDGEMPPKKPLTPRREKATSATGSPPGPLGHRPDRPFPPTTGSRAGYDWWALQPLARPRPPPVGNQARAQIANPIDAFILARLEAEGLTLASPEADRPHADPPAVTSTCSACRRRPRRWRRSSSDKRARRLRATGGSAARSPALRRALGPALARRGPLRRERRLRARRAAPQRLALPRLGRPGASTATCPYDEFVRLQLAGDVLRPGDPEASSATGFLVAGGHDTVVPAAQTWR